MGQSVHVGIPFIQSYSKNDYRAGTHNWDIGQDQQGVMYFANDAGLLSYDGSAWKQYPISNQTVFRSLVFSQKGIIYGGGQNEFGKYIPNEIGYLVFQSLKSKIPEEHLNFEDVWQTIEFGEDIYFRASGKIYQFKDNQFMVHDTIHADFLSTTKDAILVFDKKQGIFHMDDGQYHFKKGTDLLIGKEMVGSVSMDNQILFATKDVIYSYSDSICQKWEIDAQEFLSNNQIRSISILPDNKIGIGTVFGGLIIANHQGKILSYVNKEQGLLSNSILSQFWDKNGNLWLGLDKGISYLQTNSAFTRIYPDGQLEGAGYAAAIFKNRLYLGTNNGLYTIPWTEEHNPVKTKNFSLVTGSKGQNWGLDIINDQLILSRDAGAYHIEKTSAKPLVYGDGYWIFDELAHYSDYSIAGTYNGLSLFEKKAGQWVFSRKISELAESSRFIEEDKYGNIWVSHPYKGIYLINTGKGLTEPQVTFLGQKDGLPSNLLNHLFKIKGEMVFCGEIGSYIYNYEKGKFEPHTSFNQIFGDYTKIRRLSEAPNGNIWFITMDEIGVLLIDDLGVDKRIQKKVFPELKDFLNGGFEFIYPYDDENVFISTEKGFLHYSPIQKINSDSSLQIILNEVLVTNQNKRLLLAGNSLGKSNTNESPAKKVTTLPYSSNALSFGFSATSFPHPKFLQYRYRLNGFENEWSDWSEQNKKEYTNLSHGDYTFLVQAKNFQNTESAIYSYPFIITPPWYLSKWAFFLYALSISLIIYLIVKKINQRYQGLEKDHEKVIQQSKKQIDQLKNEKTQLELEHKKRALVSSTLLLVQKNETLTELKEHLISIKKETQDSSTKPKINKLIHLLQQDEVLDEGWEQFMLHFNELHGDFLKRLKDTHPKLTPKDLKLCGYLRMNLSTKEIASLMNISVRGVEASRYRIRKKCELDSSSNLTEFLMAF